MTQYLYVKKTHGAVENENGVTFGKGQLAYTDDSELARQWKQEGKAEEINASIVDEAENKINAISDDYKAKLESIKTSDNPIYDVVGVRSYEINKLKEEREDKIKEVRKEYEQKRIELLKDAEQTQLLATTKPTESDKESAAQYVQRFIAKSFYDYENAFNEFMETMDVLTDEQLTAIQPHLKDIKAVIYENTENQAQAGGRFSGVVDRANEGQPIPIYDALKQIPGAETIGVKDMQRKAIERAYDTKYSGNTHTTPNGPSHREVAEHQDQFSDNPLGSVQTRQRKAREQSFNK